MSEILFINPRTTIHVDKNILKLRYGLSGADSANLVRKEGGAYDSQSVSGTAY